MKKRGDYYIYGDGRQFKNLSLRKAFEKIKKGNQWIVHPEQDSISGPGSTLKQTREIVAELPGILDSFQIGGFLDIPCGDFNWISRVDWSCRQYIGADIVEDLILKNIKRYQNEFITFKTLDLTCDPLPRVDLIFCRDCLVHLSFKDIKKAIINIKRSGASYLMATTFPAEDFNEDIISGGWRPLNMLLPPFEFPEPVQILNEHCTEAHGLFADKSLGLWDITTLPD